MTTIHNSKQCTVRNGDKTKRCLVYVRLYIFATSIISIRDSHQILRATLAAWTSRPHAAMSIAKRDSNRSPISLELPITACVVLSVLYNKISDRLGHAAHLYLPCTETCNTLFNKAISISAFPARHRSSLQRRSFRSPWRSPRLRMRNGQTGYWPFVKGNQKSRTMLLLKTNYRRCWRRGQSQNKSKDKGQRPRHQPRPRQRALLLRMIL